MARGSQRRPDRARGMLSHGETPCGLRLCIHLTLPRAWSASKHVLATLNSDKKQDKAGWGAGAEVPDILSQRRGALERLPVRLATAYWTLGGTAGGTDGLVCSEGSWPVSRGSLTTQVERAGLRAKPCLILVVPSSTGLEKRRRSLLVGEPQLKQKEEETVISKSSLP